MVKRWILLILISVVGTPLWAYSDLDFQADPKKSSVCGLVKSAYYKKSPGEYPQAIVTVVSQSRVLKVLSEEVALNFLDRVYPDIKVREADYTNLSGFRLTWSSASMNDFHQLCMQGATVQTVNDNQAVEFVNAYESFELNIN